MAVNASPPDVHARLAAVAGAAVEHAEALGAHGAAAERWETLLRVQPSLHLPPVLTGHVSSLLPY